jgi:transcriptional regulator with XRE-family HTH domain
MIYFKIGKGVTIVSKELGEKLRQYRSLKGLTLRDVERKTKVSNAYLNQLEQGNIKGPSPHFLHKLANFYGVPYTNLLKLAGYLMPKEEAQAKKTAGVAFSLLKDLTEEEEEELLKYLEFIRQKRKARK